MNDPVPDTNDLIERCLDGASGDNLNELHSVFASSRGSSAIDAYLDACTSNHQLRCLLTEGASDSAFLRGVETALSSQRMESGKFVAEVSKRAVREIEPRVFALRTPMTRFWRLSLCSAAMLAVVVIGFFMLHVTKESRPEVGKIILAAQDLKLIRDGRVSGVKAGESLFADDVLRSETPAGSTQITLSTHATVRFPSRAEAVFVTGKPYAIQLVLGRMDVQVDPQSKDHPFVVHTAHADAEVLGTRFALDVSSDRTRLEVFESRVRFRTAAEPDGVIVAAGSAAEAKQGTVLAAVPLAVESHVAVFQNGANGYSDAHEIGITTQNAVFNNGVGITQRNGNEMLVCEFDDYQIRALLRFDNIKLPPSATLDSAQLELKFENWNSVITLNGAYLKPAWNFRTATWLSRDKDLPWNAPGAGDSRLDRADKFSIPEIGLAGEAPITISLDPAVVSRWIQDPALNNGVILWVNRHSEQTRLFTSQEQNQQHRPALILHYTVPSGTPVPAEHAKEKSAIEQF